jgi:large subunit ribosomal protein L21
VEAIVQTDGRQVRLAEQEIFEVGRLAGEPGDIIDLDRVLMIIDGGDVVVGDPVIAGASVTARIVEHGRGRKLTFMKFKSKVRYRRKIGHRQHLTRLVVESITRGG